MVARLRQMREQRERQSGRPANAAPSPRPRPASDEPDEARFRPGDQIVCTPYGRGEVLSSRLEGDHELIVVNFPAHGQLTIDAAVSAARLADDGQRPPYDDDPPL